MKSIVTIVGTLVDYSLRNVGASGNYPIAHVDIATGEKTYRVEAAGNENASVLAAIFGEAKTGEKFEVIATHGFREANGEIYDSLKFVGGAPSFSPQQGAFATLAGLVGGVVEKSGKNGAFKVPVIQLAGGGRDGLLVGQVQLSFRKDQGDAAVADWESRAGQFAVVEAAMDSYTSAAGRHYPKFFVDKVSYHPVPASLAAGPGLTPSTELGEAGVDDLAV